MIDFVMTNTWSLLTNNTGPLRRHKAKYTLIMITIINVHLIIIWIYTIRKSREWRNIYDWLHVCCLTSSAKSFNSLTSGKIPPELDSEFSDPHIDTISKRLGRGVADEDWLERCACMRFKAIFTLIFGVPGLNSSKIVPLLGTLYRHFFRGNIPLLNSSPHL